MTMPEDLVVPGRIATSIGAGARVLSGEGLTIQRPSVSDRAERLGKALAMLDVSYEHLFTRLEPVLSPTASLPSDGDTSASNRRGEEESWLADFLQSVTAQVLVMSARVEGLTMRIDL